MGSIQVSTQLKRTAFFEHESPWEKAAGGIASAVRHRIIALSRVGFEVWWANETQCARWDSHAGGWADLAVFHRGGLGLVAGRRNLGLNPVLRRLCRKNVQAIEFPDGLSARWPAEYPMAIGIQCHTSQELRGFLNRDLRCAGLHGRLRCSGIRKALLRADGVLACSHQIALATSTFFKVHPDRFRVLPHVFSADAEEGFRIKGSGDHDGYYLVVGNVEYFKSFDLIASGFNVYKQRGGGGILVFAGTAGWDDPNPQVQTLLQSRPVRSLIESNGKDVIRFLGRCSKDELARHRSRATAVLVASRFEAFTMVAGEAFLSHTPVILSDRTGWYGLAERFHAARIFDPYDSEDLANALFEMERPGVRAEYQHNGDKLAAYLTGDELVEKTANWYRRLAERRLR